jgi:uncharacterized protein YjbI with pentapeptide repeats
MSWQIGNMKSMKKTKPRASYIQLQNLAGQNWSRVDLSKSVFQTNLTEKLNLHRAKLDGVSAHASAFTTVNLSHASLKNAVDVTGSLFHGCNLRKTDFSGANLKGTLFFQCDLNGASFSGAQLKGANFNECEGTGVDFTKSHLDDAVFLTVQFEQAKLCGATADRMSIVQSVFSKSIFSDFKKGLFQARGLVVRDSNIQSCRFEGAYLYRAFVSGDYFSQLNARNASFSKANLVNSYLSGDFRGTDFTDAIADYVHFVQADCRSSKFIGTRMRGASLVKSKFQGKYFKPRAFPAWIDRCEGISGALFAEKPK